MLRRVTFLMAVCMCVGSAFGAANKIRYFTPSPVQVAESVAALGAEADPDGMAILNYAAGADKTIVQVIVSDMTPNLTYHVRLTDGASSARRLRSAPGACGSTARTRSCESSTP